MAFIADSSGILVEKAYIRILDFRKQDTPGGGMFANLKQALDGITGANPAQGDDRFIRAMFNPTSLSFEFGDEIASENKVGSVQKNENGSVNQTAVKKQKKTVRMSLELIFDHSDRLRPAILELAGGLIAAMGNPDTRHIEIGWGVQLYRGILEDIQASYELFDSKGRPMRARIRLKVRLED